MYVWNQDKLQPDGTLRLVCRLNLLCMSRLKTVFSSSSLFPLQGEDLKKAVSSFGRANGLDSRLRDALYHRLSSAMKGRAQ